MKNFKFLVAVLTVFLLGLGVYSCQKEDKTNVVNQVPVPSAGFGESYNPYAPNCTKYVDEIINNFT